MQTCWTQRQGLGTWLGWIAYPTLSLLGDWGEGARMLVRMQCGEGIVGAPRKGAGSSGTGLGLQGASHQCGGSHRLDTRPAGVCGRSAWDWGRCSTG